MAKDKEKTTEEYLNEILNVLIGNLDKTNKTTYHVLPLAEVYYLLKQLPPLFNVYYEEKPLQCSKLAREKYLPILRLMDAEDRKNRQLYLSWRKEALRMSARTSLEDYFKYREWDTVLHSKNLREESIIYANRKEYIRGYIHYLEEITTNPKFRLLIANLPSGFGKTYPEKISEAWNFGVDPTGTVLYLCSNDDVVRGGSSAVRNEIKSEWFGEVFPNLKYDENDKSFFLKETETNWKLRDCKLASSYYARTVNSNVVGVRASQRIHIDDLYKDYKEALNNNLNDTYFNTYMTVWRERFVQTKLPKIVITGTLWYSHDFIAKVLEALKKEYKFYRDDKYPYTFVNKDKTVAIVQVPALDYKTGLSTAPKLKSTEQILSVKRNIEPYLFETNYQQRPVDPDSLAFSYDKLQVYEEIPVDPEQTIQYCFSVIDATRKGKDYFSMPVFVPVKVGNKTKYFLKDCIFTKKATKDMYDRVTDMILSNHITKLVIESNVTTELANAIRNRLPVSFCDIMEKYNTEKKEIRIQAEQSVMVRDLVYPKQDLYPHNSEMGDFMRSFTSYNLDGTNEHDDANDSVAMFCHEIIEGGSKPSYIVPMKRIF